MRQSRHRALWKKVAAMKVLECLVWDLPAGKSTHAMSSAIDYFTKTSLPGSVIRTHHYKSRMFIVRLT